MKNQTIAPYSIWTRAYEKEMDQQTGIRISLGNLRNGKVSGLEDKSNSVVTVFPNEPSSHFDKDCYEQHLTEVLEVNKDAPGYCSMLVKDQSELSEHISALYQAMYFHYVLGKSKNLIGKFPKFCCIISSLNMQFSLMKKGYPNIAFLRDYIDNHAYLGLPFILKDSGEKGFIIGDPTSDQLWKRDGVAPPRNSIFVVNKNLFEYRTDWDGGNDLFPTCFSNLATLREGSSMVAGKFEIEKYFKKVFENPIKLNISQK